MFQLIILLVLLFSASVNSTLGTKDYMLCGGISTAVTDLLLFPLDTIKVTQQSTKLAITASDALKQIVKSGGARALYKGALGYALLDGIGTGVFFVIYEKVKKYSSEDLKLTGVEKECLRYC
jgi:hypothetical protein